MKKERLVVKHVKAQTETRHGPKLTMVVASCSTFPFQILNHDLAMS